jgi:WD40 repeat protein
VLNHLIENGSVRSVAWNNDGTKLATGSDDKTIRVWSVGSAGTFECQSPLNGHSRYVTSVSYSCLFVCFQTCGMS